jgi:hypothetical protein
MFPKTILRRNVPNFCYVCGLPWSRPHPTVQNCQVQYHKKLCTLSCQDHPEMAPLVPKHPFKQPDATLLEGPVNDGYTLGKNS